MSPSPSPVWPPVWPPVALALVLAVGVVNAEPRAEQCCDLIEVGHFDGGLASPNDELCPHNIPPGQWRYTDGKAWQKDKRLKVTCVQSETTLEKDSNKNEVNGKFKIVSLNWDEHYNNPKSLKYKTLANTIEGDIMSMLKNKDDLYKQADFNVKVERFKRGSVVVNFKVDYELKDAVVAIPFKLKPENISEGLAKDFQYQNGILFRRFAIPANSFNGTIFRDHCSIRGCSHKCNYDYDLEDYICTCPKLLLLAKNGQTCQAPNEDENVIQDTSIKSKTKPVEAEITRIEILTTTETSVEIFGKADEDAEVVETVTRVSIDNEEGTTLVTVPLPNIPASSNITTLSEPLTRTTTVTSVDDLTTIVPSADDVDDDVTTTIGSLGGEDDLTTINTSLGDANSVSAKVEDTAQGEDEEATTTTTVTDDTTASFVDVADVDTTTDTADQDDAPPTTTTLSAETADPTTDAENSSEQVSDYEETTTMTAAVISKDVDATTEDTQFGKATEAATETTTTASLTYPGDDDITPRRNIRQDAAKQLPGITTEESIHIGSQTEEEQTTELGTEEEEASTVEDLFEEDSTTAEPLREKNSDDLTSENNSSTDENSNELTTSSGLLREEDTSPTDATDVDGTTLGQGGAEEDITTQTNVLNFPTRLTTPDPDTTEVESATNDSSEEDDKTDEPIKFSSATEPTPSIPVTEISMEVVDNNNAVINVPGMYTIVCNVTETSNLQVTLQRSAAFAFPIRAHNNVDFDGIDLNCHEMGGRERGVHLVIDKAKVRGDISRIWEDNVRLIVDSLLVEDISPK